MTDWTLESLRRCLILATFAGVAAISDAAWLRIVALVAFVFFFFFLLRNPEGWIRRLSYVCTMLGAGLLVRLGTAIKATGWIDIEGDGWLAGLILTLEEASPTIGLLLIVAGISFAVLELVRQRSNGRQQGNLWTSSSVPQFQAKQRDNTKLDVTCTVPIHNNNDHVVSICEADVSQYRLVDRLLVYAIERDSAVTLEVESDGSNEENEVLFSKKEPMVWPNGVWKRFRVKFRFNDRLRRPPKFLRWLYWLVGLHRRIFCIKLGSGEGEALFTKPVVVRL